MQGTASRSALRAEARAKVRDAVAAAAGMFGHDLAFTEGGRPGRDWCCCRLCRVSCYIDTRTLTAADTTMERWMVRDCSPTLRNEDGLYFQAVLQKDGLKAVWSKFDIPRFLLELLAESESLTPRNAPGLHRTGSRVTWPQFTTKTVGRPT